MLIGVPKEIKNHEYRIGLTPSGARELVSNGHQVIVQRDGGKAIGLTDEQYVKAGAQVVDTAEEIFARADMIIKVKEPQPNECAMLRPGQVLYTYLHLAPDPEQTKALVASGATCIAYETVTDRKGGLPLLAPMSEVAGRMSIQAGMNAHVTILDRSLDRLKYLDELYGHQLTTIYSTRDAIEERLPDTDLVIGAVLIPGAAAPKLVSRDQLKLMRPGSVLVDVAIDQGGCFETSKATTHQNPTYEVDGIIHYCVANMPGGVARTSTFALTNATLPFAVQLANKGAKQALLDDEHLLNGLNVHAGKITYKAVADDLGYAYVPAREALA